MVAEEKSVDWFGLVSHALFETWEFLGDPLPIYCEGKRGNVSFGAWFRNNSVKIYSDDGGEKELSYAVGDAGLVEGVDQFMRNCSGKGLESNMTEWELCYFSGVCSPFSLGVRNGFIVELFSRGVSMETLSKITKINNLN